MTKESLSHLYLVLRNSRLFPGIFWDKSLSINYRYIDTLSLSPWESKRKWALLLYLPSCKLLVLCRISLGIDIQISDDNHWLLVLGGQIKNSLCHFICEKSCIDTEIGTTFNITRIRNTLGCKWWWPIHPHNRKVFQFDL